MCKRFSMHVRGTIASTWPVDILYCCYYGKAKEMALYSFSITCIAKKKSILPWMTVVNEDWPVGFQNLLKQKVFSRPCLIGTIFAKAELGKRNKNVSERNIYSSLCDLLITLLQVVSLNIAVILEKYCFKNEESVNDKIASFFRAKFHGNGYYSLGVFLTWTKQKPLFLGCISA